MADESNVPAPTPQVEPEPQNALTEKFTEKEWAAVKELRVCCDWAFLNLCTACAAGSA